MKSPSTPRNVAVVGLGSHAENKILPALLVSPYCHLQGVCSSDFSRSRALAERFHTSAYANSSELFADTEVDTLYLAGLPSKHYEWAQMALEHGRHVWCEKPLCRTTDPLDTLFVTAKEKELSLFEGFMFRYHPQLAKFQDLMGNTGLGKVHSLSAKFGYPHLAEDNFRYNKDKGGGALLDAGAYPIAAALSLFGPDPLKVTAQLSSEGFEVDTSGHATLSYAGGEVAHLEWGMGRSYRNELEVWGERACLKAERIFSKPGSLKTVVEFRDTRGQQDIHEVEACDHFEQMLAEFARSSVDSDLRSQLNTLSLQQHELMKMIEGAGSWGLGSSPSDRPRTH